MSDRPQWRCNDNRRGSSVDVGFNMSVDFQADAYGWNRPQQLPGQCRPQQPATRCPEGPVRPAPRCPEPAPRPSYNPPGNFERNSGTSTWNNSYDRTATGGGRGYDYGSQSWDKGNQSNPYSSGNWDRGGKSWNTGYDNTANGGGRGYNNGSQSWDKGNYSNPVATGNWDKGNQTWNQGSDQGRYGTGQWSGGQVGWNNGYENNRYTGTHQQSSGNVEVRAGNDYGSTGGAFGWNARNDNGYKTGGLGWNGPLGSTSVSWNGTDSLYSYKVETNGIAGSTAYTFGTAPRNYYNR